MIDNAFVRAHVSEFEDFWNRRLGDSFFEIRYPAYGYEIHLQSNDECLRDAAMLSAARYSVAKPLANTPPIEFVALVSPSSPDTPVPADLSTQLQTVGARDFIFQAATPWVQWFVDLGARRAIMSLSLALAGDAAQVSRNLLDRAMLNLLVREGVGQLHATTLVRDDCALVLVAPHGTGKSTTAFLLLNKGFQLMGDGLLFAREHPPGNAAEFELMGYPVGEVKLTDDAKTLFPQWDGQGAEVTTHGVVKHVVNLQQLAPNKVTTHSFTPKRIVLCLLERNGTQQTGAERLKPGDAMTQILPNTIFWDDAEAMTASLGVVDRLLAKAECYSLALGRDQKQLVEFVESLAK